MENRSGLIVQGELTRADGHAARNMIHRHRPPAPRHDGYALSLKHRKRIEEAFGWAKTVGGLAQRMYRGLEREQARFMLTMAANNLARLPRLLAA